MWDLSGKKNEMLECPLNKQEEESKHTCCQTRPSPDRPRLDRKWNKSAWQKWGITLKGVIICQFLTLTSWLSKLS